MCVRALTLVLLCAAPVCAQDQPGALPSSLDRVRDGLEIPIVRQLSPARPVPLRPTFRSGVDQRVYVRTLEEDLHKTFDLTVLQRQSAAWSAQCCGIDLGIVFNRIEKALDERRKRLIRERVARELAKEVSVPRRATRIAFWPPGLLAS